MFDRPPRQSEFLAWIYVVLWSGLIFVTVPIVRSLVDYVRGRWAGEVFTYGVTTIVILLSAGALALLLRLRRKSVSSYVSLLSVAGLIIYLSFEFKEESPVEAVHFLQYGLLSLLLYRAFSHRVRDYSIYIAATIAGTIVGMIDETVQWMTPGRHFQLTDIWLNLVAVVLVQIALIAGFRPGIICDWPKGASLRRLCRLVAVAVAYLGLCLLNTPDRVAWYTSHIPALDFIDYRRSVMSEYGYLHGDAATARFRSRLTAEELRHFAKVRAEEGARILGRYRGREQYSEFLDVYTPVTDPFLHEAKVHLYSRDVNLVRARTKNSAKDFTRAYWENRILEDYFGGLLFASNNQWPAVVEAEVTEHVLWDQTYESRVSHYLITDLSERQVFWLFLSAVVGLLLLSRYCSKRSSE